MKEVPVLFNGDMVRAILSGEKTQARRPIKEKAIPIVEECLRVNGKWCDQTFDYDLYHLTPFGKTGDVLWVRETFGICPDYNEYRYKADLGMDRQAVGRKWTPSIHMPRKACRIKLRVKRVWVERIQNIDDRQGGKEGMMYYSGMKKFCDSSRMMFQHCWNSIYGTWDDNPFVWCCEFEIINQET